MKLTSLKKSEAQIIKKNLTPQLLTHPLFMYYCPNKSERTKFIGNFLDYYLFSWTKYGEAYVSDTKNTVASLVSTGAFEYKFKGKNALKMKLNNNSANIFIHRHIVADISDIIVPGMLETRILTIYGQPDYDDAAKKKLILEITQHAKEKGFAIVFETFSKKMVNYMEQFGFEIAYQKQFVNTRFFQTMMTYNI